MVEYQKVVSYDEDKPWNENRPLPIIPSWFPHESVPLYHVERKAFDADWILSYVPDEVQPGTAFIKSKIVMKKLQDLMLEINYSFWNIDVWGMYEEPSVLRYNPSLNLTSQVWHTDYFEKDRSKVSMSVLLNKPTKGGRFQILHNDMFVDLEVGDALIFPGWLAHKIHAVKSGERKAVVSWLAGPPWR